MSRKYRHQGYQDNDREERSRDRKPPPKNTLTAEEKLHRKGMRHAIAREANEVIRCPDCGRGVQNFDVISPGKICPFCSAALHCCRTCRHFDSAARWQCRAEITTGITAKSKDNDCTHYAPRLVLDTTGRRSGNSNGGRGRGGPKEQFENLFKR